MNTDENNNANKVDKKKLNEKESEDYQMVEEGWTYVAKSGKHFTK
jgi:hypothetical protein